MMSLNIDGGYVVFLLVLIALAWIIPIVMLIIGIVQLKRKPTRSKVLLIISGIWLIIGIGVCGSLLGIK